MPDFEIKITTPFDDSGAKKATDELGDLGKSAKKSGEQIEHSELSHRQLKETIREGTGAIGAQIPAIGLLTEASTAGFGAAVIAAELFKKVLENIEAPARRAAEAVAALDAERYKAAAEEVTALATALGSLIDKQNELQAAFDRGTTAMDNRIKKYDEQRDGILKVAEAEEKAFEAEIDHQVALGTMTKEQGADKKEGAKLTLDSMRGQNDEAKLQFEINQRADEFSNARLRLLGGHDRNAVTDATQKFKAAEDATAQAKIKLDAAEKTPVQEGPFGALSAADAREQLRHAQEQMEMDKASGKNQLVGSDQDAINQLQKLLAAHDALVAPHKEEYDAAVVNQGHAKTALDNANAQAEADEKLSVEGAERIKALQDELAILQQVNAATHAAQARTAQSHAGTAHVEAVQSAVEAGERALHTVQTRNNVQPATINRLIDIVHQLASMHTSHIDVGNDLSERVNELETTVQNLEQYANSSGNVH